MSAVNDGLLQIFSDPRQPTVEDIIAVGGKLDADILVRAYEQGIFPWPHEGYPLLWFAPEKRGVIEFKELHIPQSFKKWLRKNESRYEIREDNCFKEVVHHCRLQKRQGQKGSWINNAIEKAYLELFNRGRAFSVEVFRDGKLVGGIYGVRSERYESCESMFHLEDNVSKLALFKLIERLRGRGRNWMDIQMVTSVCESFGGKLIAKNQFLKKIGV